MTSPDEPLREPWADMLMDLREIPVYGHHFYALNDCQNDRTYALAQRMDRTNALLERIATALEKDKSDD